MAAERSYLSMRARRVVRELRKRRQALGWTLDEAAARSGLSPATISRTESGEGLRVPNVVALLAAYGADSADSQALAALARQAQRQGWWTGIGTAVMRPPYRNLAEVEQEAGWKRSFEPLMIPSLLQTPRYARAVLCQTVSDLHQEQFAEKEAIWTSRWERPGGMQFTTIILEEVLRRPIGPESMMTEQLATLLDLSLADDTDLRILPVGIGLHPGTLGAFSYLGGGEPASDAVVVYVETPVGDACFEDDSTVGRIDRLFWRLHGLTLNPDASRALIDAIRRSTV